MTVLRKLVQLLSLVPAVPALAQTDWLELRPAPSRLVSAPGLGSLDQQEREYAWGDLDHDGWTDLVVARKKPFMSSGLRVNVLFMNEGGVLVDRTGQYASQADVTGDQGFLTPTNDRDVTLVDVDLDGWLDVVTATTLSDGHPKHVSHPRVYRNLGLDAGGNWLGLRYEEARIPDFGTFSNFCGMAAGDVTGDGYPDLYFAHYEQEAAVDLDDRLLVNDGAGFFSDESTLRLTAGMRESGFGTSAAIMDFNLDGVADIVKNTGIGLTSNTKPRVDLIYNDPANEGFFNILDTAYAGAPYHVGAGDLNQDGRADLVIGDDAKDRYLLSEGNDGLGRVIWSTAWTYGSPENTFSTNTQIADLDDDGWPEVFIGDMDPIFAGCDRRLKLYHNRGGTVGGFVDLTEEAGAGWTGAVGLTEADLEGSWDVAVFDIDGDGDSDLIVARCGGTDVWLNDRIRTEIGTDYCDPAVVNSSGASGELSATGSTAVQDADLSLHATSLPTNQFGYFLASETQGFVANPGGSQGNLCLGGTIGRFAKFVTSTGPSGELLLEVALDQLPPPLPPAVLPGDTWNFQAWFRDVNPTATSNFTHGSSVTFDA